MRSILILAIIILVCFSHVKAQEKTPKGKINVAWVYRGSSPLIKGVLYSSLDSSVIISNSYEKSDYLSGAYRTKEIHYKEITTIKIRSKNSILKGAAIGCLSGMLLGVISGLVAGDDPPCPGGISGWFCVRYTAEEKALIRGISYSLLGTGLGLGFGAIKISLPINKNKKDYDLARIKLMKRAYKK